MLEVPGGEGGDGDPAANAGASMTQGAAAVSRSSDVQRVADLLEAFVAAAGQGWPADAIHSRLPGEIDVEPAQYGRLLELAAGDGLITTGAKPVAGSSKHLLFPLQLTEAGNLYLDAWRAKGRDDRRWGDSWSALLNNCKPLTPANMLAELRKNSC